MKVLIVNGAEVRSLLPMSECIEVMSDALTALAHGDAILPLRPILWLPEKIGALGMMPAYLGTIGAVGLKVVTVFPGNHGTRYDSHQGAVLLFESTHGQLLAMMDASMITAIRTAAVSGLATRLLSKEDAQSVAILGSGVQARTHVEAMLAVRKISGLRVWSRDAGHAEKFVERERRTRRIEIGVAHTAEDAVRDADIICTTTSSREPVLQGSWIKPGAHINAVGSSVAFARELDTAAVVSARMYVDRRESTLNESGDFLIAKKDGAISDSHIVGEIGDVLIGKVAGRGSSDEITLFKSLGLAVEDLASANHIYKKAIESGSGTLVELGGERDED